jgi:hypothetical protein
MLSRNSERQPTPELLKEAGDVVRTSGRSIREVANELSITYAPPPQLAQGEEDRP